MSEKEEDYLKAIYIISEERGFARSMEIAEKLDVKPASVTDMLKKLQIKGLVKYEKYRGILLTKKGREIGKKLMRKWEILKNFFKIFGVEEENAEKIADRVEHYLVDESFSKIEKFVEFIGEFKENPKWLEHFHEFVRNGELPNCERLKKIK